MNCIIYFIVKKKNWWINVWNTYLFSIYLILFNPLTTIIIQSINLIDVVGLNWSISVKKKRIKNLTEFITNINIWWKYGFFFWWIHAITLIIAFFFVSINQLHISFLNICNTDEHQNIFLSFGKKDSEVRIKTYS